MTRGFNPSGILCLFSRNPHHNLLLDLNRRFSTNSPKKLRWFDFGNVNCCDDAQIIYNVLMETKPLPNKILFNKLLSRLVKIKEYKFAASIFNDVSKSGVSVDIYTLNIMINCYSNSHRVDFGFSMLGTLFKLGYIPNEATLSPLLKGLFRENRIGEAQQLFRKIVRDDLCQINNIIFGVVVDGLCKSGNTKIAVELLRVMEKGSCRPGTREYSMVIDEAIR